MWSDKLDLKINDILNKKGTGGQNGLNLLLVAV